MLTQKGRVQRNEDVASWTRRTLHKWQMQEATLTPEVALATSTLNLPHSALPPD